MKYVTCPSVTSFTHKSFIVHKNRVHVFDPMIMRQAILNRDIDLTPIKSFKIYVSEFTFYGFGHDVRDIHNIPFVEHKYITAINLLINVIFHHQPGTKCRKVDIVRHSGSAKFVRIANMIAECCKKQHVPYNIVAVRNYEYCPSYRPLLTKCDKYGRTNIFLSEENVFIVYCSIPHIKYSSRGLPLISSDISPGKKTRPILTVEDYCKWYDCYIIDTNGSVSRLYDYNSDIHSELYWIDHAPTPLSIIEACLKYNLVIDRTTYSAIYHRFMEDCEECVSADVLDNYIPPGYLLERVLTDKTYAYCEYFNLPWAGVHGLNSVDYCM